jgi:hypothetical protein
MNEEGAVSGERVVEDKDRSDPGSFVSLCFVLCGLNP